MSEKASKKIRADEHLHAKDGDVDIDEPKPVENFEVKLNKYGFLHVPKRAVPSLPFKIEEPLTVSIEGNHLTIASKNQPKTEKA